MARYAIAAVLAVKVVATLATDNRYGFHRDELYYVVASQRLAWGYVDFPPLTPALARVTRAVLGDSLVALRSPALAAGVATVLLTVAMAKHLGGSSRAQWLAGLTIGTCGFFVGANGLFQTVSFDILAWTLAAYAFVRVVTSSDPRWWLAVGAAIGVGMLTKYTMATFAAAIAVGVLLTPLRRQVATRWPWSGAALALAIAFPNLAWQVSNGWISIDFLRGQNARVRAENSVAQYVVDQLVTLGPLVLIITAAGLLLLWRTETFRPLFWAVVTVELAYLLARGKGYYALDIAPLAMAAGAVAVAEWASAVRVRALVIGMVVYALIGLPLALPVLPQDTMLSLGLDEFRDDYSAELGWPLLVGKITRAHRSVRAQEASVATILTRNYSQAAAVDVFAPALPDALSGHNAYWVWFDTDASIATVVAVGFDERALRRWFGDVRVVDRMPRSNRVDVEERGAEIAICREPLVSASALRREVRLLT